jgi:hypothetical protein
MLSVLSDPAHERHAEFVEWYGRDFDPKAVDTDRLEQAVAALAKLMRRRKGSGNRSRVRPDTAS